MLEDVIKKIQSLEELLEKYKIPKDEGEVYIKKEIEDELFEMHIIRVQLELKFYHPLIFQN